MNSHPLVSIIITNHNYERYLRSCIESALNQTYPYCEVIVVDDGSSDGSRALLEEYASRCAIIYKEQGGQASAIDSGYAQSNGVYVLFLDADDLLYPDAIGEVCQMLEGREFSKLHFQLDVVDANEAHVGRFPPDGISLPSGNLLECLIKTGSYLCPPCSGNVFARNTLDRVLPFHEVGRYKICADLYLLIRSLRFGEVVAINQPLGAYRVHGQNAYDVTNLIETDPTRLKRRYEAVENRKQLILDEFKYAHGDDASSYTSRWYGVFGLKDLILCRKFTPKVFGETKPRLFVLVYAFVLLVLKNEFSSTGEKLKALCFAGVALLPRRFLCLVKKFIA